MEWAIGLFLSVVVGGPVTWLFLNQLRKRLEISKPPEPRRVPAWLTGHFERLFFTLFIGVGVEQQGAPTAMVGWLGLKMLTNWNHPSGERTPKRALRFRRCSGGLLSMTFAGLGGMVILVGNSEAWLLFTVLLPLLLLEV